VNRVLGAQFTLKGFSKTGKQHSEIPAGFILIIAVDLSYSWDFAQALYEPDATSLTIVNFPISDGLSRFRLVAWLGLILVKKMCLIFFAT